MKLFRGKKRLETTLSAIAAAMVSLAALYFLLDPNRGDRLPDEEWATPTEETAPATDCVEEGPYSSVQEIDYETLYCKDPSLLRGAEEILSPGRKGQQESIGKAVYVNGGPESITVSETVIQTEPVPEIVAVGTGENAEGERQYPLVGEDFLYTSAGEVLYYSRVEKFSATAYTAWVGDVTGTTACGTQARVGAVAVDPGVIPYYTKMYIVSEDGVFDYGESSAEDCGGAIKGKIIDLYFNTLEECYRFGRRDILVYFLD